MLVKDRTKGKPKPEPLLSQLQLQVPPHNQEVERALLGAICLTPDCLYQIIDIGLDSSDFYIYAHQLIFEAIIELSNQSKPFDVVHIGNYLESKNKLADIGGTSPIAELFLSHLSMGSPLSCAQIVKEKSLLRKIISATTQIASEAFSGVPNVDEFLDKAEAEVYRITDAKENASFSNLKKVLSQSLEMIFDRKGGVFDTLKTGFTDFDQLTSGLSKGQLLVLAARPGMGKTSLVLSIVKNIALNKEPDDASVKNQNKVVAIFSLEMSKEELAFRFLSAVSKIPSSSLKKGKLQQTQMQGLITAADILSRACIFIDDGTSPSIFEIRSRCRRLLAQEKKLDLVVIDYLQLMRGSSKNASKDHSREREISEISRGLKNLAKELKVPVVALSQLNRGVETRPNKRPMLSDLRECVTGDTQVLLADGSFADISSLVGKTPYVKSFCFDFGQIKNALAEKVWFVGKKAVFQICLEDQKQIQATAEHRFYVQGDWIKLKDLQIGQFLSIFDQNGLQEVRIVEIISQGEKDVFDLTVPQTACWFGNHVLTHNSGAIEQDADIVVFIYRDEVYNKETDKKGIAELIVAKHRAGETKTVELKWNPEFTEFANLSRRYEDQVDYSDYVDPDDSMEFDAEEINAFRPEKGDER
jgi:replicative DNA helicase